MVMALDPVLSAYPQEVIYRTFVFERYGNISGSKYSHLAISIVSFTLLHIIYDNWIAIVLSFFVAIIFTVTYHKTKSLTLVTLEHAILGNIVFTIGLGHYFCQPLM